MKKTIFCLPVILMICVMTACSKKTQDVVSPKVENIPFTPVEHYFVKNNVDTVPAKILTKETMEQYFGMAATMGADGRPTEVDFEQEFLIAATMPTTNQPTELTAQQLLRTDGILTLNYAIVQEAPGVAWFRPLLLVKVDRKYADDTVILAPIP